MKNTLVEYVVLLFSCSRRVVGVSMLKARLTFLSQLSFVPGIGEI